MKNVLMIMRDKLLQRKRSVIETVNDQLKNNCHAEHSRHKSFGNFITNLVASLIVYSFQEKKPGIKFEEQHMAGQLALFCLLLRSNSGHKSNLLQKMGAKNIAGLIIFAAKHNLINVDDIAI